MFGTILKSALAVGVTAIAATIGVTGAHDGYTSIRRKLSSYSKTEAAPRKKAKKKTAVKAAARRRPAKRSSPAVRKSEKAAKKAA